jgi:hypothetical protein
LGLKVQGETIEYNHQILKLFNWVNRTIRNFFAYGEGPFGRRPYNPNNPVDPVYIYLLERNPINFLFRALRLAPSALRPAPSRLK